MLGAETLRFTGRFKSKGLPVETWRMSSKRYLVLQGRITRSSHYDDDERVQRKRRTAKYIMDRVKSMKHELMLASIPDEQENVEESEWVTYARA